MNVGNDLNAFALEITERFEATSATEISDLQIAMAGFDLAICSDVLREMRMSMPGNHRIVDSQKLMENARRMHVARSVQIEGEPKRQTLHGIPFSPNMPRPDRRTDEQKRWDEHRAKSRDWVNELDPIRRDELLELALQHWPDGDERAFFRSLGEKSCIVRDEMIRVSTARGEAA